MNRTTRRRELDAVVDAYSGKVERLEWLATTDRYWWAKGFKAVRLDCKGASIPFNFVGIAIYKDNKIGYVCVDGNTRERCTVYVTDAEFESALTNAQRLLDSVQENG